MARVKGIKKDVIVEPVETIEAGGQVESNEANEVDDDEAGGQVESNEANEVDDDDDDKVSSRNKVEWDCSEGSVDAEIPEGFSFDTHKPIKRKMFAHDKFYYGHRAELFRLKLAEAEEKRDFAAKYGSKEEQKAVKKFQKLSAQIEELQKSLGAKGVDVSTLLESMGIKS